MLRRVDVEVLRRRPADRCRSVRLRVALKLEDGLLHLGELVADLVEQRPLALRRCAELLLRKVHARDQAMLDGLDGDAHDFERGHELSVQRHLIGAEAVHVSIEDASHIVVDLEQFILQSLQTIGLAVVGINHSLPCGPVEIVLAAQVSDKLLDLNECHRPVGILLINDIRHSRTNWRARAGARRSSG